jgi:lipid II:glycine glycyltransferase (peptidoglycan interpeptide bridge formation enzyme)
MELRGSYDKWFSRSGVRRQNIRRAEKEGVTVEIGGAEFLDDFYRLFLCSFNRWKSRETARRPHEHERFKRIFELPGSKAKIAVARYNEKIISAAIFCPYKRTAAYIAGGSDFEYQNKRAGNLLHSEIIRYLIDNGISEYNLGMSLDIKSLERFKESLGAAKLRTVILERHRFPRLKRIYQQLSGKKREQSYTTIA